MKVEVRGSTVPISEALDEHIVRRLQFALRRFSRKVEGVVLRLVDLNGPKGGLDKRCRIAVRLTAGARSVLVEATDADAYAAVSRAAARLDERVGRALSKPRDRAAAAHRRARSSRSEARRVRPVEWDREEAEAVSWSSLETTDGSLRHVD